MGVITLLLFFFVFALGLGQLAQTNTTKPPEPIRISTSNYGIFINCTVGSRENSTNSEALFNGYGIEVIRLVFKRLRIEYELNCISKENFNYLLKNNLSDAYIGNQEFEYELIDLGFIPTVPLYDSALIFLERGTPNDEGFDFLKVFDVVLWIIIIFTTIFVAHLIWVIEKSSKGDIKDNYLIGVSRALWNMIIGFFYTSDANIKTFAGRIIYAVFIFMILVVKIIYIADFTSENNRRYLTANYASLDEITIPEPIGILEEHSELLKTYNPIVKRVIYKSPLDLQIFEDLRSGKIIGAVMDGYQLVWAGSGDESCQYLFVGNSLKAFNFPLILRKGFSWDLKEMISEEILRIRLSPENDVLINKYYYANSTNCKFNRLPHEPILFKYMFGPFAILLGFVGVSVVIFLIAKYYENKRKALKQEIQQKGVYNNFINNQTKSNRDINMLIKFDKILTASEQKFKQRINDICVVLERIASFYDRLRNINGEIELISNNLIYTQSTQTKTDELYKSDSKSKFSRGFESISNFKVEENEDDEEEKEIELDQELDDDLKDVFLPKSDQDKKND